MQRRMEAGLYKYIPEDITVINYATYAANVVEENSELAYEHEIKGMWCMKQYISLLMGEIPPAV